MQVLNPTSPLLLSGLTILHTIVSYSPFTMEKPQMLSRLNLTKVRASPHSADN